MAANAKFAGGAKDAESERGKMFIGGLSWETTHDSLMNYFSRYGEVTDCVVMKNTETGRSRGFGFITFSDPANVDLVMQSSPHTLDNRTIDPKPCNPRAAAARVGRRNLNGYKVFLGGLPANLTETDLRNFFSQYGKVTEVVIMYDQEQKKSRGFGFLSFESEESVDRCVSEHYVNINGKQVEVKKAEPRDTRGGGGGGGRGGYQGGWDGSGQGGQMGGYQGWGGPGGQGYGYGPQGGYPGWGPPGQWGGYGAPGGPQGGPQGGYGGWGGWGGPQGGQSGPSAAGGWGGQGGQSGPAGGSGAAAPPGTDGYGARGSGAAGGPPGAQPAAGGAAGAGGPAKPADGQQYGGYSSYGYGTDAGQGYRGYGTGGQDGTGYGAAPGYGNPEGVPPPAGGKGPAGGPPGGPGPQRGATGYNQSGQAPGYHPYRRM